MGRLQLIEFLKGYAMFTIVLLHYFQKAGLPAPFDKLILFGGTGIHLFIVLSGFGLYLSFLKKPLGYTAFVKKRLSKVYIPYIVVVFISALVALFVPVFESSWYALGGHVFLYKMFDESIVGSYGYQLWFVSMILQFYFTFHLLAWWKRRSNDAWFIGITLGISLAWALMVFVMGKETLRIWNSFFLQYLWEFALGMVLAKRYSSGKISVSFKIWHYLLVGIVGCLLYAAMALKGGEVGRLFNDIPALIGYSALAIFLYQLGINLFNRFFLYTGYISFSLFLLHMLLLQLFITVFPGWHILVCLSAALAVTYPLCHVFQLGIGKVYKGLGI